MTTTFALQPMEVDWRVLENYGPFEPPSLGTHGVGCGGCGLCALRGHVVLQASEMRVIFTEYSFCDLWVDAPHPRTQRGCMTRKSNIKLVTWPLRFQCVCVDSFALCGWSAWSAFLFVVFVCAGAHSCAQTDLYTAYKNLNCRP